MTSLQQAKENRVSAADIRDAAAAIDQASTPEERERAMLVGHSVAWACLDESTPHKSWIERMNLLDRYAEWQNADVLLAKRGVPTSVRIWLEGKDAREVAELMISCPLAFEVSTGKIYQVRDTVRRDFLQQLAKFLPPAVVASMLRRMNELQVFFNTEPRRGRPGVSVYKSKEFFRLILAGIDLGIAIDLEEIAMLPMSAVYLAKLEGLV